jgi:uncharacterized protein YkwD
MVQALELRCLLSSASALEPTAAEEYMLELINQARTNPAAAGQQFVSIVQSDPVIAQATRSEDLSQFLQVIDGYGPEPPLAFNTGLIEAALDHDNAMLAANGQFHSPPGYLNDPQVATAANGQTYFPTGNMGWATGENIFAYSANVPSRTTDVDFVNYFNDAFFLDWGNPDFGHLKNLLAPGPAEAAPGTSAFSEIGIGLLTNVVPTTPPDPNNPIPANTGLNVGPDIITQEFGWTAGNAFLTGVVFNDGNHSGFYAPGEGIGSVVIEAIGQSGQGTFQTETWDSGGYSLQLPPGSYEVTASGGGLPAPQSTTITIGQDNVAWNVTLPASPSSPTLASSGGSVSSPSAGATSVSIAPAPTPDESSGVVVSQSLQVRHSRHQTHSHAHPLGALAVVTPHSQRVRHAIQIRGLRPATHYPTRGGPVHGGEPGAGGFK